MTIRLSALFENKLDELLLNFYRDRTGSGRRTRLRSRQPRAEDQPGPSGVTSMPRRTVTPRARPELVPRLPTRASSRRINDGAGPSSSGDTESLRMRISLSRGSVVSTTGLGDPERKDGGSSGGRSLGTAQLSSSSTRRRVPNETPEEESEQRTRTRSRTSHRGESGARADIFDETPNTHASSLNGPSTRYSTRSRSAVTRHDAGVNGVNETADQDSDEYDEESAESEETGEESSEGSEGGSPQGLKTSKSSRSGKAPVSKKGASKKAAASRKGKQVARPRARSSVSENEEPVRSSRRTGLRNHVSTRYDAILEIKGVFESS